MASYTATVIENVTISKEYTVEAESLAEAKVKLEAGDTVDEHENGEGEVVSRVVMQDTIGLDIDVDDDLENDDDFDQTS